MALPPFARTLVRWTAPGLLAGLSLLQASEPDARIVAAARATHNFQTYLLDDKINIVAKNGSVTLTGQVRNECHRALAEETVAGLPGVKGVNNQLNLLEPPGAVAPDPALRAKVQTALRFHRQLGTVYPGIDVAKGVVTLTGVAVNARQKQLVARYVQGLEGVERVVNDLSVGVPRPPRKAGRKKIDDASLTAQARLALRFTKATRAIQTQVVTENGVVQVSGAARSREEREQVTRAVQIIDGIKAVRNRMTVEG
jgi:osmotically-inducible protein OsmY